MDCSGKNPVSPVTSNDVKETQIINFDLNLNARYFTYGLKICLNV